MAHRVLVFFFAVILGSVLVNGQSPMGPTPGPTAPSLTLPIATPTAAPTATPTTLPAATPTAAPTATPTAAPTATPTTAPTATPTTVPTATPTPSTGTPGASGSPPIQAAPECATLTQKCKDDMPFSTGESIWWVGKLYVGAAGGASGTSTTPATTTTTPPTTTTTTPPTTTPTTPITPGTPCAGGDNKCSITSYTPDSCQAIKLLVSRDEDGSIDLTEATFNKATNSVALFDNNWLVADPQKAIVKQQFGYYATLDQNGNITVVDPTPDDVKTSQAVDLVLIGASDGGEWALFSTCCKSVVFVIYNDATICAKATKNFDAAITALLTPLGIQPTDLKDIPTEITINLDKVIPPLPPTSPEAAGKPAAAGTTTTGSPAPPGNTTPPSNTTPPGNTPP